MLEKGGVNPTGELVSVLAKLTEVRIATFRFLTAEYGIVLKTYLPFIENKL